MSYGKAGIGAGLAGGIGEFGRILAQISSNRRQDELLAEQQRRQDELRASENARTDSWRATQLSMDPRVSTERPGAEFTVPGMTGMMSGAQMPDMQVRKDFEGVNPLEVGDRTLYFDPNQPQRQERAENREAYEMTSDEILDLLGDGGTEFNPNLDYTGLQGAYAQSQMRPKGQNLRPIATRTNEEVIYRDPITLEVLGRDPMGESPGGTEGPNLTDAQSKSVLYSVTGELGLSNLAEAYEQMGGPPSLVDRQRGEYVWANPGQEPQVQQFQQAARSLLSAILRKESGAAITPQEMAQYGQTYIPQPGDSPEVVQQKLQAARIALDGIRATTGGGTPEVDRILGEYGVTPYRLPGSGGAANPYEQRRQQGGSGGS